VQTGQGDPGPQLILYLARGGKCELVSTVSLQGRHMNAKQTKTIFDVEKCQTQKRGAAELFDCLVEEQHLICGYALPFGNGHFCKHPQREEFAKRLLKDKQIHRGI
jgi:hypothetical protein